MFVFNIQLKYECKKFKRSKGRAGYFKYSTVFMFVMFGSNTQLKYECKMFRQVMVGHVAIDRAIC